MSWTKQTPASVSWIKDSLLDYLLTEAGEKLLQEDESGILLETSITTSWTKQSVGSENWGKEIPSSSNWSKITPTNTDWTKQ